MGKPFSLEIQVRFYDLDPMGHVNNASYVTYLEIARGEYHKHMTKIKKLSDIDFILHSIKECNFKSAASLLDELVINIKPTDIRESSWTYEYEIREKNSNRLIVEAKTVQVSFDYKKRKKKPINETLKQKLLEEEKRVNEL